MSASVPHKQCSQIYYNNSPSRLPQQTLAPRIRQLSSTITVTNVDITTASATTANILSIASVFFMFGQQLQKLSSTFTGFEFAGILISFQTLQLFRSCLREFSICSLKSGVLCREISIHRQSWVPRGDLSTCLRLAALQ